MPKYGFAGATEDATVAADFLRRNRTIGDSMERRRWLLGVRDLTIGLDRLDPRVHERKGLSSRCFRARRRRTASSFRASTIR